MTSVTASVRKDTRKENHLAGVSASLRASRCKAGLKAVARITVGSCARVFDVFPWAGEFHSLAINMSLVRSATPAALPLNELFVVRPSANRLVENG